MVCEVRKEVVGVVEYLQSSRLKVLLRQAGKSKIYLNGRVFVELEKVHRSLWG